MVMSDSLCARTLEMTDNSKLLLKSKLRVFDMTGYRIIVYSHLPSSQKFQLCAGSFQESNLCQYVSNLADDKDLPD